jgi:hypothetical protein
VGDLADAALGAGDRRTLLWARAIENLAVVVSTQNLFSAADKGLALVATPEEIIYESTCPGTGMVEISLDRVRYLRASRDSLDSSTSCGAKQGVLSDQWQRPELHARIYPRPLPKAAE